MEFPKPFENVTGKPLNQAHIGEVEHFSNALMNTIE